MMNIASLQVESLWPSMENLFERTDMKPLLLQFNLEGENSTLTMLDSIADSIKQEAPDTEELMALTCNLDTPSASPLTSNDIVTSTPLSFPSGLVSSSLTLAPVTFSNAPSVMTVGTTAKLATVHSSTNGSKSPLCKVCNDESSGFHYGVDSCEGCKGFFRRCITQGMTHKCSNNEKCEITPFTRNSCQYCRMKKCFAVGMSREASRLGRRPKKLKDANSDSSRSHSGNLPIAPYPSPAELHRMRMVDLERLLQANGTFKGELKQAFNSAKMSLQEKYGSNPLVSTTDNKAMSTATQVTLTPVLTSHAISVQGNEGTSTGANSSTSVPMSVSLSLAGAPSLSNSGGMFAQMSPCVPLNSPMSVSSPQTTPMSPTTTLTPQMNGEMLMDGQMSNLTTQISCASQMSGQNQLISQMSGQNPMTLQMSGQNPMTLQMSGQNLMTSQMSGQNLMTSQMSGQNPMTSQMSGQNPMTSQMSGQNPMNSQMASNTLSGNNQLSHQFLMAAQMPGSSTMSNQISESLANQILTQMSNSSFLSNPMMNGNTNVSTSMPTPMSAPSHMSTPMSAPSQMSTPMNCDPSKPNMNVRGLESGYSSMSSPASSKSQSPIQYSQSTGTCLSQPQAMATSSMNSENANTNNTVSHEMMDSKSAQGSSSQLSAAPKSREHRIPQKTLPADSDPKMEFPISKFVEKERILAFVKYPLTTERRVFVEQVTKKIVDAHVNTCNIVSKKVTQAKMNAVLLSDSTPEEVETSSDSMWQQFVSNLVPEITSVVMFCKKLPGFFDISQEDQIHLIKEGSFECCLARFAMLVDCIGMQMLDPLLKYRCSRAVVQAMPMGDFFDEFFEVAKLLNPLKLTDGEIGLFSAVLVMCPDRKAVENQRLILTIQSLFYQALYLLMMTNRSEGEEDFKVLLNSIPKLREINHKHCVALNNIQMKAPEKVEEFPELHREVYFQ